MNFEKLKPVFLKAIGEYKNRKEVYDKMYDYCITGKTDAYREYKINPKRSNIKIRTNFIKKFIKEEVSYLLSNPITYTSLSDKSNNPAILQAINKATSHWSANHNKQAFRDMLTYGSMYELYYTDEVNGELTFNAKLLTPRNSYALRNDSGEIIAFFRFFYKKFDEEHINYIDIYTKEYIYHCDESLNEKSDPTPNNFNEVPVREGKISDYREFDTLYNEIKDLVDGYQTNLSDIVNEISDYRLAYLVLIGAELDDEEKDKNGKTDLDRIKEKGILVIPDGGDARFLTKDFNDSFIKNTLETLKKNMYELSNHIDTNEKMQSNLSGSAIRNRLIGLEQRVRDGEGSMKDLLKGRFYFLFKFLSLTNVGDFDYRDVGIKFTLNIPQDDLIVSQVLAQAPEGMISKRTGRGLYSFISDPVKEGSQVDSENKEELNNVQGLPKPHEDDEIDES